MLKHASKSDRERDLQGVERDGEGDQGCDRGMGYE